MASLHASSNLDMVLNEGNELEVAQLATTQCDKTSNINSKINASTSGEVSHTKEVSAPPMLESLPSLGLAQHDIADTEAPASLLPPEADKLHTTLDFVHTAEGNDDIISGIPSMRLPLNVTNSQDATTSSDFGDEAKLSEKDGRSQKPVIAHTEHENAVQPAIDLIGQDAVEPVSLEYTPSVDQPYLDNVHKNYALPVDHMAVGEEKSAADQLVVGGTHDVDQAAVDHINVGDIIVMLPPITADQLEIDSTESDADSAIGICREPSTVSAHSSIYDVVEENERTYHRYKEGKYLLPNDELEQNRLDLQHHLFVMTLSGHLHLAPLSTGIQDVLDLGTGTGIWAVEFATKHPSASVIGTDLSPIQPSYVPPNCSFEVDDAEDLWLFSNKFDYIHGRALLTCFRDFTHIARQAFEFMKPGGYFELQDGILPTCYDNSWEGSDLQRLMDLLLEGAAKIGMDWNKVTKYKEYLAEAGFEDIHEIHFAWPSNDRWPKGEYYKNLGRWNLHNMLDAVGGGSMGILTRVHGWTKAQVEELMVGVKRDLADRNIHAYIPVRVVYGRRPLE